MLFFPLAVNKEVLITAFDKILHGHLDTPEVADRREDGGGMDYFCPRER